MNYNRPFANIYLSFAALLLLAMPARFAAQSPVTPTDPAPTQSQATIAESEKLGPQLHGLQGVLIETLDGKIVASQGADERFNPASSIKLATAFIAIRNLGLNHRFTTGFWTDGSVDKATGTIQGNLYVTGRDPSFHYEHAVMIAKQLNNLGIRSVSGNLIVAPGFTMNFSSSARGSGGSLYDTLDATLRSSEATRAWAFERTALGDAASLQTVSSLAVR